jgi:hypothetical protein
MVLQIPETTRYLALIRQEQVIWRVNTLGGPTAAAIAEIMRPPQPNLSPVNQPRKKLNPKNPAKSLVKP